VALKLLKPQIGTLAPRISNGREGLTRTQYRAAEHPWRAWYGLKRWKELRLRVLIRDRFTCRMCGKQSFKSGTMVCDHVVPHRGDGSLFWDESNLQILCADPCHNTHKQNAERFA
jgi:5-methylcytosine-specific restriction endonuclease McrA